MSTSIQWCLLAGFGLMTLEMVGTPAFAGGDSSSGGGAMVCRDSQGNITSAELLDLWEVQLRPDNAQVVRGEDDVDTQIARIVEIVKGARGLRGAINFRYYIDYVRRNFEKLWI